MRNENLTFILKIDKALVLKSFQKFGFASQAEAAAFLITDCRDWWSHLVYGIFAVEDLGVEGWMHPDEVPDCDNCERIDPENPPDPSWMMQSEESLTKSITGLESLGDNYKEVTDINVYKEEKKE